MRPPESRGLRPPESPSLRLTQSPGPLPPRHEDLRPADPRPEQGLDGERRAAEWLAERGYRILASRWRCRSGELDLIALDRRTIVFVEVRSRTGESRGRPEETVGPAKRHRLASLASIWLARQPPRLRAMPCRFDVIALSGGELRHLPDAFRIEPARPGWFRRR